MSLIEIAHDHANNPLEVVEHLAAGNNWPFERAGEDEVAIIVTGRWTNYQVSFTWMSEIEALHLACAFDMRITELRLPRGAATRSAYQRAIVDRTFRHLAAKRRGDVPSRACTCRRSTPSGRQCEAVLGAALDACERYFPAFQFVVWAGKSAREAMETAMFETSGEA